MNSPGETAVFTVSKGMSWFIPQGALHCLNNISEEKAELLVGFANDSPQNIDLPVAFNGIPAPIRDAYTSPHEELKKWKGPISNPFFGTSYMVIDDMNPQPVDVKLGDYFFVPTGMLHTFINTASEDFEVVAFFSKANPLPEISLLVATSFFPDSILRQTMTTYGITHQPGDPLKDLRKSQRVFLPTFFLSLSINRGL